MSVCVTLLGCSATAEEAEVGPLDTVNDVVDTDEVGTDLVDGVDTAEDADVAELRLSHISGSTTKICQLVGEVDRQTGQNTTNQTLSQYGIYGTDLGASFQYEGQTIFLFGDTVGTDIVKDGDLIAYTQDDEPEDCLQLTFPTESGAVQPIAIDGVSQGAFEVPTAGVSSNGTMYLFHTTDHSPQHVMGRSVVAASPDGGPTFTYLYDFSTEHFINVAVEQVAPGELPLSELAGGDPTAEALLVIFGSAEYRKSPLRLALEYAKDIDKPEGPLYFSSLDEAHRPTFSPQEQQAATLFPSSCIGEFSVAYLSSVGHPKWIVLYNCDESSAEGRGIIMRSAPQPWGAWSEPEVIFDPWTDNGYCHFIHTSWTHQQCDSVHDPSRENEWGGEYGPYVIRSLMRPAEEADKLFVYFTMSTWNPYTVVLMRTTLVAQ